MDEILSPCGSRIAIKVDVEGHENRVLKWKERYLQVNECVLLIEATFATVPWNVARQSGISAGPQAQ